MRRREFIALAGGAAAWPLAARAQQGERMRRVGVLMTLGPDDPQGQARLDALRSGLRELGWSEGRNLRIDYLAEQDVTRISPLADQLVATNPDVIVAAAPPSVIALQKATRTTPIVFVQVPDPVRLGLVQSLARPGGNVTGFMLFDFPIAGKWVELLKQLAPTTKRVVALAYHASPTQADYIRAAKNAAEPLDLHLSEASVRDAIEIENAVKAAAVEPHAGLIVLPSSLASAQRSLIAGLASRHRLPAVYPYRYFPASGGLASYGVDNIDTFRRAASYVDRILKGERPADLPVQAPTKYELVINLKTAKALDLDVPLMLLARADEVIE